MSTAYLVVKDMTEALPIGVIELFNERHIGMYVLEEGATFEDLRAGKIACMPIKGAGGPKFKDSEEYWVMPYSDSGMRPGEDDLFEILTVDELYAFGWDIPEELQ
jgi:hypothetical protein